MSGIVRGTFKVQGKRNTFPFGPFQFDIAEIHDEFVAADIELVASTSLQILGGVDPIIADITTGQFLMLVPDQSLNVGFEGVDAQTAGFTLSAGKPYIMAGGTITQLEVHNNATVLASLFIALGGT